MYHSVEIASLGVKNKLQAKEVLNLMETVVLYRFPSEANRVEIEYMIDGKIVPYFDLDAEDLFEIYDDNQKALLALNDPLQPFI